MDGEKSIWSQFASFAKDEQGQDLVEYTLLLAFVCLASAALFIDGGKSLSSIWTATNTITTNAATVANAAAS
jgi:Flp pilus assembly pilin Flp